MKKDRVNRLIGSSLVSASFWQLAYCTSKLFQTSSTIKVYRTCSPVTLFSIYIRFTLPWFQRLSCYKAEEGKKEPLVESVENLTSMFESVQNWNLASDWVIIKTFQTDLIITQSQTGFKFWTDSNMEVRLSTDYVDVLDYIQMAVILKFEYLIFHCRWLQSRLRPVTSIFS